MLRPFARSVTKEGQGEGEVGKITWKGGGGGKVGVLLLPEVASWLCG